MLWANLVSLNLPFLELLLLGYCEMDSSSEGPLGPSLFMGPDAFRFRFNPSEVNCYRLRNLLICLQLAVMRDIAMALLKIQPIFDCIICRNFLLLA